MAEQIRRLIAFGLLVNIALLLAVSYLSYDRLVVAYATLQEVVENHNQKLILANQMLDAVQQRRYSLHAFVFLSDDLEREAEWERFNAAASDYLQARYAFAKMSLSAEETQALADLDKQTQAAQAHQLEVVNLRRLETREDAESWLWSVAQPAQQQVIAKVEQIVNIKNEANRAAIRSAELGYKSVRYAIWALDVVAIAVGITAGLVSAWKVKQLAQAIDDQKRRYQGLFEANIDALLLWRYGKFVDANKAALHMFGLTKLPQLVKLHIEQLFPRLQTSGQASSVAIQLRIEAAHQHAFGRFEMQMQRQDQQVFPALIELTPLTLPSGPVLQMLVRDMSESKDAKLRLEQLAYLDVVTKLPNAAAFRDELQRLLNQARQAHRKVAVLQIDLIRFKRVNDSLGHVAGDIVLCQVGQRLSAAVNERDKVARLSGDDFLIACAGLNSAEEVARIAQRLLAQFNQPFIVGEHRLILGAQLGISLYPDDGYEVSDLLSKTELALHRTGGQDSHYQFYNETMHADAYRRLLLEESLQRALDRGEFVLHYQPRMTLPDRRMVGVEALLRWVHPERGLLLPEHFIAVAEESGLLLRLSDWICRTACTQAKIWQDQGWPELQLTINLSPRQFLDAHFLACLETTLRQTQLPPETLELDLSERITLHDETQIFARLRTLKTLGVQLAIDDFGSGYSALSYLKKHYPLDTLKIDRTFMHEIPHNPASQAIAAAMIQLAHSLKAKVLAEGVETEAQLEFLQTQLCDAIQGYYLGSALPAEGLTAFLRNYRADIPSP